MKKRTLLEEFQVKWNTDNQREYRKSYDKAIKKLFNQNYSNGKFRCYHFEIRDILNSYIESIDLDDLIIFNQSK